MQLTQGLRRAAQIRPNGVAIRDGGQVRDWRTEIDRVARLAGALRALGLAPGDRVSDVTLVPTMLNMLISHPRFGDFDLASFKRIYFGASPTPDAVLLRALALLPHCKFQQAWGMTELSPIACTMDWRHTVASGPHAGRLRSCGQPVPMVELRIVDADGNEVPRGMVGEIVVRGPTVMQGYWQNPEATAAALRGGWLHSGDEAFVYIVDRLEDMIVAGGENVHSAEVESAISLLDGVAEVAMIGIPDETWGEAVHAIVVPRPRRALDPALVIAHCRGRIAGYKLPRSATIRTEPLPLSAAGKVLKTELREPYWRGRDRKVN